MARRVTTYSLNGETISTPNSYSPNNNKCNSTLKHSHTKTNSHKANHKSLHFTPNSTSARINKCLLRRRLSNSLGGSGRDSWFARSYKRSWRRWRLRMRSCCSVVGRCAGRFRSARVVLGVWWRGLSWLVRGCTRWNLKWTQIKASSLKLSLLLQWSNWPTRINPWPSPSPKQTRTVSPSASKTKVSRAK